jgi:flagellin|tara:strand:+ start:507 stop:2297 length:1791 start_codon:yes stop_codon:yes gene_type:complete
MALVVGTNVSSLTAQRALAESNVELHTAMERLSTGSKINSAADDAAGLAMTQRMTAQVRGLGMAVKNANDGQALTQSIEGALGEVSDMLQRMRELALQAANGTNSSADRSFLQSEVNLLIQEISRVSANTRYNGELILDGTFINKSLQVGIEEGENIVFSQESIASEQIGAHTLVGNGQGANAAATDASANEITINDDIEIFGFLGTKSTAASATDSAKETAVKVNNLTGETGVKAYAKTYATVYSNSATAKTYSVKINGYETGNFVISSGDAESAVDAINQISGSTGVTASSADNKIVLFDSNGDDITVENTQGLSGHSDLRVQKLGEDGKITSTVGSVISLSTSGANDSTRVSGTLKLVSPNAFSIDQKAVNQVETVVVGTLANYWDSGTDTITIADGTTTVTVNLTADPTDIDSLLASIQGAANYGDLAFEVTKKDADELYYTWKAAGVKSGATYVTNDAASTDESISTTTAGVNSKGYYVENSAAATLKNLTQINVSTMIQAGDSISIVDAALDKVAQMRSNLGAIENRLAYTVSNLMNIAEKTADARSRLVDADYALESARLAKAQVIQQAGTQMLKQANQLTQLVLDLLR